MIFDINDNHIKNFLFPTFEHVISDSLLLSWSLKHALLFCFTAKQGPYHSKSIIIKKWKVLSDATEEKKAAPTTLRCRECLPEGIHIFMINSWYKSIFMIDRNCKHSNKLTASFGERTTSLSLKCETSAFHQTSANLARSKFQKQS